MDSAQAKAAVVERVDALSDLLIETSHEIHGHPELCFEERQAHDLLVGILDQAGLDVTPRAYGVDTAFEARAGTSGPTVVVCCEYDALPGVGHACGHNVIAAAGLGAGLAVASLADQLGGRVRVLGTPAEEGGGGKILMAEAGAFAGVDAAMMVHPADADLASMTAVTTAFLTVEYHGQAAHAAAYPELGRNALDAAVLGYLNVAALRQHITATDRVHGIFTKAGDARNVVPEHAVSEWMIRTARFDQLDALKARVLAALEAGAAATGCTVEHSWTGRDYADLVVNRPLLELYRRNSAALGRPLAPLESTERAVVGSTDMGNVSHLVPTIHPMVQVAPAGVPIHSHDFTDHAASAAGDRAVLDGAKAMACTIVDLWTDPDALAQVRQGFPRAS